MRRPMNRPRLDQLIVERQKQKFLVPNGQTAVIGGIYQSDETETENGVPGLKDIPVFGWLFKQKSQERVKNELLLFLTPRILER